MLRHFVLLAVTAQSVLHNPGVKDGQAASHLIGLFAF
jgi:hypothetical protein